MSKKLNQQRRSVLGAGLIALAGWRSRFSAARAAVPQDAAAPMAASGVPLAELNFGQVQLLAGPLERQAGENHRLVLQLDEDSLLLPYRLRAGQPAAGQELGGWYDTYAFAPGAQFGQWLSALARHHAITGDEPTRAKTRRMVRGLAATIDAQGSFYRKNRFPCYTYDKLVGGLLDAHQHCQDEAALTTLRRATQAAMPHLPPHAFPRNEHEHFDEYGQYSWDESYTLPENQFLAWHATAERRHLDLGRRLLYDEFFGALARGQNALPGKHAYSHVNALSSAAQAYLTLGNPMHLDAARHGFDMVAAQSFATGGWGPDEHFIVPGSGALGLSLEQQHKSFETPCGAYAHFKLTRYLLRISRDSRYGDSMEQVLYNTVLGALPIQPDGHAFYYSDYTQTAKKDYHPDRWPCCAGTLPMIAADYYISTCFTDPQGIYVNLYVPAQVRWTHHDTACGLSIATAYPYDSGVTLTLTLPRATVFTLNLRIPAWAQGAGLRINGQQQASRLDAGRFAALRREWQPGDIVQLELPLTRGLQSVDELHPDTVALRVGPLVLMPIREAGAAPALSRQSLLAARRSPDGAPVWQASAAGGMITLKPFVDIGTEDYRVYQQVLPS